MLKAVTYTSLVKMWLQYKEYQGTMHMLYIASYTGVHNTTSPLPPCVSLVFSTCKHIRLKPILFNEIKLKPLTNVWIKNCNPIVF